jgi:hypothetical protein
MRGKGKSMSEENIKPTGCCEIFDPASWQEKEITWNDKLFVKDRVVNFFHIPLNFGQKVIKNMDLIEKASAKSDYQLMLTDENSLWGRIFILMSSAKCQARRWQKFPAFF